MNRNAVSSLFSRGLPARLTAATLALALAGGFGLTAFAQPHGRHGGGMHDSAMMGGPMGGQLGGRGMERMLDGVNATAEQRAQIQRIVEAARKDLQGQREQRRALHEQGMKLFAQPTVDANAVEQLRQQRMAQHDQASRRMTQAMLEVSQVLTPEQRQQLAERRAKRQELMQRHLQERRALEGGQR